MKAFSLLYIAVPALAGGGEFFLCSHHPVTHLREYTGYGNDGYWRPSTDDSTDCTTTTKEPEYSIKTEWSPYALTSWSTEHEISWRTKYHTFVSTETCYGFQTKSFSYSFTKTKTTFLHDTTTTTSVDTEWRTHYVTVPQVYFKTTTLTQTATATSLSIVPTTETEIVPTTFKSVSIVTTTETEIVPTTVTSLSIVPTRETELVSTTIEKPDTTTEMSTSTALACGEVCQLDLFGEILFYPTAVVASPVYSKTVSLIILHDTRGVSLTLTETETAKPPASTTLTWVTSGVTLYGVAPSSITVWIQLTLETELIQPHMSCTTHSHMHLLSQIRQH